MSLETARAHLAKWGRDKDIRALRCFVWVASKPVNTSIGLRYADVI